MDNNYRPNLQRLNPLDTARGLAVLGILLVNIYSFALPEMMRSTPLLLAGASGLDLLLWYIIRIFADTKFITLLTLIFGASLWFFGEHKDSGDRASLDALHLRRSLCLLGFGVVHAYLIWDGDVLFSYAVCALLAWGMRHKTDVRLCVLATVQFVLGCWLVWWMASAALAAGWLDEQMAYLAADGTVKEIAHYQQGWIELVPERIVRSLDMQLLIFVNGWTTLAFMLVGIVLARRGFFSLQTSMSTYRLFIALTLIPGLMLTALGLHLSVVNGFEVGFIHTLGYQLHFVGGSLMGISYLALLLYWCRLGCWQWLQRTLATVGKMALSVYILQSLICTWLFYGFGLGLYGQLSLTQLLLVILAIWLFLCVFAIEWLRRYQFGPLEWLLRSLVYQQRQVWRR